MEDFERPMGVDIDNENRFEKAIDAMKEAREQKEKEHEDFVRVQRETLHELARLADWSMDGRRNRKPKQ